MGASLGAAYVGIRGDRKHLKGDFNKALRTTDTFAGKMQKRISRINFKVIGIAAAAAATAAVYAMRKVINVASDLQETTGKFDVVFKGQEAVARAWSRTLVDAYAMSTRESKLYLSSIQDLLVPMGMNAEAAGKMSYEVVKLSADLGSFNNLPTAQVMADMESALVGNFETMKKYGIVLNETVVKQEAYDLGLVKTGEKLNAAQKSQAAYSLMVKGSAAAVGDLAKTSDSYANLVKKLTAMVEDITAFIGDQFLPIASNVVKWVNKWIKANQELIRQKIQDYIKTVKDVAILLGDALKIVWDLLIAPPLAAIKFMQDLSGETETATEKAKDLKAELVEAPGEIKTAWMDLLGFFTVWGDNIVDVVSASFKTILKTIYAVLNQTGRLLELAFRTYNNITSGHFKQVIKDVKTFAKDTKNVFGKLGSSISSDWKSAIDRMMKRWKFFDKDLELRFKNAKRNAEKAFKGIRTASQMAADGLKIDTEVMGISWAQYMKDIEDEATTTWAVLTDLPTDMLDAIELGNRLAEQDFADTYSTIEKNTIDFAGVASRSLSESFFAVIKGDITSLGGVFKSFIDAMIRQLTDFLASKVVSSIIKLFSGGLFGGGGSGGGGILSGILSGIGKIFGFQEGGIVPGEGPQLAMVHGGEIVLPLDASKQITSGNLSRGSFGGIQSGGNNLGSAGATTVGGKPFTGDPVLPDDITKTVGLASLLGALSGGGVGAFSGAIGALLTEGFKAAFGFRGASFDVPALLARTLGGPIGAILSPVIGMLGDAIGDLTNLRSKEPLRDMLESSFGYKGGRLGFAESFHDKVGTEEDPLGVDQTIANFTGIFDGFIEKNKEAYAGFGIDVQALQDENFGELARSMGFTTSQVEFSLKDFGVNAEKMSAAFGLEVDKVGIKGRTFSQHGISAMSNLEAATMNMGLGISAAAVDMGTSIETTMEAMDRASFDLGASMTDALGEFGEVTTTAIDDISIDVGDFSASFGNAMETAENNVNDAVDRANDAANNARDAADRAGTDGGDSGQDSGQDTGGYGTGQGGDVDTDTGYATGSWFTRAGGRTHAGEIVIPRSEADKVRKSKITGGGQDSGRPIKIVLQIGRSEWAAEVNAIRDVERVKLAKRPVGSRRISY